MVAPEREWRRRGKPKARRLRRAFSYDAVRGLLFLAHHLDVLFRLFTSDVGLVADHHDVLIDRLGRDDHALFIGSSNHIILSEQRGRRNASHYADSDDI